MSKKQSGSGKRVVAPRYRAYKVLCAVTILVACGVVCIGGVNTGAGLESILYRCLLVTGVIGIAFGVVIKVVASYEETRSG
jgi:hypothetical protein